jgi:glutathione S-transferase
MQDMEPSQTNPVALSGSVASPYTRKMLGVLRYRRIPYRFIQSSRNVPGLPQPKVSLLPTFYFPDRAGELVAVTDSTPIIRQLETIVSGRSVRPASPALALIDSILEDYGDEWLTKAMFHYRWHFDADSRHAAKFLAALQRNWPSDGEFFGAAEMASARQIPRLQYVGSNEKTWAVIEASYVRFLDAMENHLRTHQFLMGARPGASDFGIFGQLTQLGAVDPTPMGIVNERAPRVYAWTWAMEDRSGLEPIDSDWLDPAHVPSTIRALLTEVARVYAPLLIANEAAVKAGHEEVRAEIDDQIWVQRTFPYQAKCLGWLRSEYAALSGADKKLVDAALAGTGLEAIFVEPSQR